MDEEDMEKTVMVDMDETVTARLVKNLLDKSRREVQEHLNRLDYGPELYHYGYKKLRAWAYGSLDIYKHELLHVLYPVFIHCFMDLVAEGHMHEAWRFFRTFRKDHELMHLRDLQELEGILLTSHLEEMELARSLRPNKVNIKLCEYSYDLLFQYLQKTQFHTMLGMINEHINFEVYQGQPASISDDAEAVALVGGSQDIAKQINQKELCWGLLEDSVEERLERALLDSEKAEGENKEPEQEDNKKKSTDVGKQPISVKKDKLSGATGKKYSF